MKKSIFTLAFVAVAAISANAHRPFRFVNHKPHCCNVEKSVAIFPGKTAEFQAAEKTFYLQTAEKTGHSSCIKKNAIIITKNEMIGCKADALQLQVRR